MYTSTSTLYSIRCIQVPAHYTVYDVYKYQHIIQYTSTSTLYSIRYIQVTHIIQYTMYTSTSTLYSIRCIQVPAHYTVYDVYKYQHIIQYTMYTSTSTLYSIRCIQVPQWLKVFSCIPISFYILSLYATKEG